MKELMKQHLFWDHLNQMTQKGVRSLTEQNFEDLGVDKGVISCEGEIYPCWFGAGEKHGVQVLMKLSGGHIGIELLVGCTRNDCLAIVAYYGEIGITIELFNRECTSCVRSRDNSVFAKSCEVYRESFNNTNQFIAILDKELNMRYANLTLLKYLDMTMNEVIGVPYWELSLWQHSMEVQNKIIFSLEQMHLGQEIRFETSHQNKQGEIRDIDFIIKPIFNSFNDIELMIALGYDVTESKLTESVLKRTEKEMKLFFDYSVNGYFINRLEESVFLDPDTLNEEFTYVQRHEQIVTYNNAILQHIDIPATKLENTNILICWQSLKKRA